MKRLGPFYTLAAGIVLAAGLGVASAQTAPRAGTPAAGRVPYARATTNVTAGPSAGPATAEPATPDPTVSAAPATADPTPRRANYAGVAKGNGGLVALAIRDGRAIAYFCDGRVESWLRGAAADGTVILNGKGSQITATLDGTRARGSLRVGKAKWRFTAPAARKPAGLYRAAGIVRGARLVGGWIVLADGRQVGLLDVGGTPAPAPTLTPGSPVTVDGTQVSPQPAENFLDQP
ncbi:hypothetical protein Sru01_52280 [Sphaerisporangium rufum]|uniref:Serine/threonine protein kinase n=1 Tax=Sphaerisporangium rufum TaxID=1381558 RepID=A0A919V0M5_9ACTN|nr:hypothetical protein [Sphaerisporangium rufum]GII80246.1 hypothetical protein Sru01_52280 [Sphaerisporangium rufum]